MSSKAQKKTNILILQNVINNKVAKNTTTKNSKKLYGPIKFFTQKKYFFTGCADMGMSPRLEKLAIPARDGYEVHP